MPQDLQIYLNRVVRPAWARSQLPTRPGEHIVVMLQRQREPAPELTGWRELARRPWGKRWWYALTQEER
jgi:hypothetical protein